MGRPDVDAGPRDASVEHLRSSSELRGHNRTIFATHNRWWVARRTVIYRAQHQHQHQPEHPPARRCPPPARTPPGHSHRPRRGFLRVALTARARPITRPPRTHTRSPGLPSRRGARSASRRLCAPAPAPVLAPAPAPARPWIYQRSYIRLSEQRADPQAPACSRARARQFALRGAPPPHRTPQKPLRVQSSAPSRARRARLLTLVLVLVLPRLLLLLLMLVLVLMLARPF